MRNVSRIWGLDASRGQILLTCFKIQLILGVKSQYNRSILPPVLTVFWNTSTKSALAKHRALRYATHFAFVMFGKMRQRRGSFVSTSVEFKGKLRFPVAEMTAQHSQVSLSFLPLPERSNDAGCVSTRGTFWGLMYLHELQCLLGILTPLIACHINW